MYLVFVVLFAQEPLSLEKCVVAMDNKFTDVFEVYEASGEMFIFKVSVKV